MAQKTAGSSQATTPPTDQQTKVLIIEDEPALLDIYSTKLRLESFDVLTAQDGIEGFQVAMTETPSIILLDIIMPIKDGFEVLKDLKAQSKTKEIPVIILSNLGQDYEVKRGMALGAANFLTKANLTPAKLVEEVRKTLTQPNMS